MAALGYPLRLVVKAGPELRGIATCIAQFDQQAFDVFEQQPCIESL
jgi:hypothetical protein